MGDNVITNPVKVIRAKCMDCCCGSALEVEKCTAVKCPLHPFRFGKNPYRKQMSDEQKKIASERMREIRQKQLSESNQSVSE